MEYAAIIDKLGEKILPEKPINSVADEDEETKWRRYRLLFSYFNYSCVRFFSFALNSLIHLGDV